MTVLRAAAAPRAFAERMGVFFESDGLPRIAGRVFGLLLVSGEPRSLDELAAMLGVSKASVSTDTRLLERRGLVERVGRPGDRRTFYQVVNDLPRHSMEFRMERLRKFRAMIADARRSGSIPGRQVMQRLRGLDTTYALVIDAMAEALEHSHRRRPRAVAARR
jgi:DNA-binding transcriptional ArsR family regulator